MALGLIRDNTPDLVFCDVVMPGISGLVVLKQIKAAFPTQKVVLMSGLNEENILDEALASGAETFLEKPVSFESLEKGILKKFFPT